VNSGAPEGWLDMLIEQKQGKRSRANLVHIIRSELVPMVDN